MGKPRLTDRPVEWKVSVPSSVAVAVEFKLMDPLTGKARHGARARLITQLLREWLGDNS